MRDSYRRNRSDESQSEADMSRDKEREEEEEEEGGDHLSSFAGSLGLPRLLYGPFSLLCPLPENGAI